MTLGLLRILELANSEGNIILDDINFLPVVLKLVPYKNITNLYPREKLHPPSLIGINNFFSSFVISSYSLNFIYFSF